jgi:hypothetical protein
MKIRTSQTLPKKYNIFTRIDQLATYGTKPIKNKDSKKNGLVIDLSAKDICFNYSMNFEIMMAV